MQILDLLGMYFDAVVVKVKTFLLLFRLALAILCQKTSTLILRENNALICHRHRKRKTFGL